MMLVVGDRFWRGFSDKRLPAESSGIRADITLRPYKKLDAVALWPYSNNMDDTVSNKE